MGIRIQHIKKQQRITAGRNQKEKIKRKESEGKNQGKSG